MAALSGAGDRHPGRQVGHTGSGQDGVGIDGVYLGQNLAGAEGGGTFPGARRIVLVDGMGLGVGPPRQRVGPTPEPLEPVVAEPVEIALVGGRFEDPVTGPGIEVAAGGGARLGPERDVLAVRTRRQPGGVEPPRVGAEGGFHHGQHPVGGDLRPVPDPVEALHHLLDGGDHAPARRPRPPRPFQKRFGENHVAGRVGHRPVHQGDVGDERGQQAYRSEGGLGHGEGAVLGHRGPLERAGDDGGQAAGGGFQSLGEGEDRPVLDLDRS